MSERHDVFKGVRPPGPPPELRSRVLRAAREAALDEAPAQEPWWSGFSRLDLAWVAALVLLILGNIAWPQTKTSEPSRRDVGSSELYQLAKVVGVPVVAMMQPREAASQRLPRERAAVPEELQEWL